MKKTSIMLCGVAVAFCGSIATMPASADTGPELAVWCPTSKHAPDITRDAAVSRGKVWVDRNVGYDMSQCYNDDTLGSYRTDCSGFVSMAWDLPQSYTTFQFDPSDPKFVGLTHSISWSDLQPGDALVLNNGSIAHMGLFAGWIDSNTYLVYNDTTEKTGTLAERVPVNDGYWSEFHPIRYNHIQQGPAGWAMYANGRLRIAQTGSSGKIYTKGRAYPGSTSWASWTSIGKGGDSLSGVPAFVHHNNQYDLFAVGPDGKIWHRYRTDGSWKSWYTLKSTSGTDIKAKQGTGVAAVFGKKYMRLFYLNPSNHIVQTWYHDGWRSKDLGGDFRGTPSALITGDRTEVYATDANGYIYHRSHRGSDPWTGWIAVKTVSGGHAQAKAGTGVAGIHGNGRDRIFYISPSEAVYQTYYDEGWHSQNLGGDYRHVPAVVITGNQIDLFAAGAAGNVYHRERKIGGSWSSWTRIADAP